jgi:hypothetical protein
LEQGWNDPYSEKARAGLAAAAKIRQEIRGLEADNNKVSDIINASGARGMSRAAGMGAYNRGERFPKQGGNGGDILQLSSQRKANRERIDELSKMAWMLESPSRTEKTAFDARRLKLRYERAARQAAVIDDRRLELAGLNKSDPENRERVAALSREIDEYDKLARDVYDEAIRGSDSMSFS